MPRIRGYSYTSLSYIKKVPRTGAPLPIREAGSLEDQENVASTHVLDARDVATMQMLQDLSSTSNISQEDLVTSLRQQLKNSWDMLQRSRKKTEALALEHKTMVGQIE